jgi:glycosyltransferase involved in cell wall biosynthesis
MFSKIYSQMESFTVPNTPIRILFLCHSASRNGATILLLHLISWLKTKVDWEIEVLMNGRGPMLDEFRAVCKTKVWRSPSVFVNALPQGLKALLDKPVTAFESLCLQALMPGSRYHLIYANTGAIWQQVNVLLKSSPALLWHIHELAYGLRLSIGADNIDRSFKGITKFVAVSKSVRDTLSLEFGVHYDKIDLVHGFVPLPKLSNEERQSRYEQVKNKFGWSQDSFVVGGCGSLGWRKGTDLFLQIANIVCRAKGYEKVRFLWVGGGKHDKESMEFDYDMNALGLQQYCQRISVTDEVSEYYCAMDVFALTSREDPFPLVMLEAGAYGVPTVCFADSGGGSEFIGDNAGLIAPYLDVAAFAAHIMNLYGDSRLRSRLAKSARKKVQTQHIVESQGPKIMESIMSCLAVTNKDAVKPQRELVS